MANLKMREIMGERLDLIVADSVRDRRHCGNVHLFSSFPE